jgi:predicted ATP-dependent endonuclease of OLD family
VEEQIIPVLRVPSDQFKVSVHHAGVYLTGISNINVFVGVNNSGKSQFLRYIFKSQEDSGIINYATWEKLVTTDYLHSVMSAINSAKQNLSTVRLKLKDTNRYLTVFEKRPSNANDMNRFFWGMDYLSSLTLKSLDSPRESNSYVQAALKTFNQIPVNFLNQLQKNKVSGNIKSVYVPVLRGLRPISKSGDKFDNQDLYSARTISDYFETELRSSWNIYTGITIYDDVMKLLLGSEEERILIRDFQDFIGKNIFSQKITLIPKHDDDVLHIQIGDTGQREIYSLGDGLQSILIILFVAFINRDSPACIFVEEPELHLHPKWQRKLIESLKMFRKHYYFFSTHSAAFINIDGASIYNVIRNNGKTHISNAAMQASKRVALRALGYNSSDLFQTNFVLWVEGPSDRYYIKAWLNIIAPEIIYGDHYSILYFGGSNYRHLVQDNGVLDLTRIASINQNFGIILDSDRKREDEVLAEDKQHLKEIMEKQEQFIWITKFREIENYIPSVIFKEAVFSVHGYEQFVISRDPFEDRNKVTIPNSGAHLKSRIKLPQSVFTVLQKNKGKLTTEINCRDLRKAIEICAISSKTSVANVDKVNVAIAISRLINEDYTWLGESKERIQELAKKIIIANNL